ncbi:hypothetical protein HK098_008063 [Nowakowskiella sp. JEL0407]|nr:hypothetical protein HK098_008063 [Nowakowskiella sp. JEL0407]
MKYIESHKTSGSIIFIFAFAISTSFLIPATPLTIAAGIIFRPLLLCIILVLIGFQVGLLICYVTGTTFLRPWIESRALSDKRFVAVDRAVAKEGFRIVVLLRLSPVIPFGLNNYILSMTSIPLLPLMFSTFLGNVPGTVLYCFVGSVIGSLADEYQIDPRIKWVTILFSFVFLTGSVVFITTVAKRALRVAMISSPPSDANTLDGEISEDLNSTADTDPLLPASSSTLRSRTVINVEEANQDSNLDLADLENGKRKPDDSDEEGYTVEEKALLWRTTVGLSITLVGGLFFIFFYT